MRNFIGRRANTTFILSSEGSACSFTPLQAVFAYQDVEKEKGLGDDFDTRILTRIERPVVKAQRLTMRTRFMPLFKAAAMIAVLFLMGTVVQHAVEGGDSDAVSVHDEYQDSTTDPQVAYEPVLSTDTVAKITVDDTGAGKTN